MRLLNNIGSAVIEKILMVITAIMISGLGVAYLTNTINNSITEQESAKNAINLLNYVRKSPEVEVTKDSLKVNIDGPITSIFADIHSPKGFSHNAYPNGLVKIKQENHAISLHFYVKRGVSYYVYYDCSHLKGTSFYWNCVISKDKKIITNIRFGSKEAHFPPLIKAVIKKDNYIKED